MDTVSEWVPAVVGVKTSQKVHMLFAGIEDGQLLRFTLQSWGGVMVTACVVPVKLPRSVRCPAELKPCDIVPKLAVLVRLT